LLQKYFASGLPMPSDGANEPVEKDLNDKIVECNEAISRNPRDAKAHRQRGLIKARLRRYDDALLDFDRTLILTPNDAHTYGLRALVWAKKGDRFRAISDFDVAIRLAPQNAELYRSNRDRVLAETPRVPVEGGDFNLLKNPFVLLGLPLNAAPTAVKEAYEDAVEDEVDSASVLMRAQQTLLTPRLRTEAEVSGFLDVDPRLVAQIVSGIRSGDPIDDMRERVSKLHSLPKSNVVAHYGSAQPLGMNDLCDLVDAQASVMPGAVCDAINDVREEIALGRVDRETVSEALSKLLDRQSRAVIERLGYADSSIDLFDRFVSKVVTGADSPTLFRLDACIRAFTQMIAPELSKRSEAVASACEAIRKNPTETPQAKLETALQNWIFLLRPIQTYETYRQREDASTREMYGKVRDLVLWLANEKKEFDNAGKIVAVASKIFGHLPRAATQMTEEKAKLVDLRNEQLAEELLNPLLQACEAANKAHRIIENELLKAGFGIGSVGITKDLFNKFQTAVRSTVKLPFSDAPWRLVRDVVISLNNDSSVPHVAEKLLQGLLVFANHHPPSAEMIGILLEDQRTVLKIQVENDLGKSLQAQKWKAADKLIDRLLILETDEEKLNTARTIRENVTVKRKAMVRRRWFWAAAAAGVVIWIALSDDDHKSQTTNYRPPPATSTTTTRNNSFAPVDASEAIPPIGSGFTLSRSNIRYCSYQGLRLEAAREAIVTEPQRQGFNSSIDDYNARCSRYRYLQADKDAVDAELPGKQYSLAAEGRRLAASW
jgi:tetratricopeptide (TPR) repeat protein